MTTDLSLALIAAITSLIIAFISLLTAIITNRQSARSSQMVETMKHSFSRQSTTESINDKEFTGAQESLKAALQAIQHLKDELQLVIMATGEGLSKDVAIKRISSSRQEIFEVYEKHYMTLNEAERKAFHTAKNIAHKIESSLTQDLTSYNYASEMSPTMHAYSVSLRNELGDLQQILIGSRLNRLVERLDL
jgi:hypothetical protein